MLPATCSDQAKNYLSVNLSKEIQPKRDFPGHDLEIEEL
jgi:hypothetical protein